MLLRSVCFYPAPQYNFSVGRPLHQELPPRLLSFWTRSSSAVDSFLAEVDFPDAAGTSNPHTLAGAPAVVWVRYDFPGAAYAGPTAVLNVTLSMYNKTLTRLPEGLFLRFRTAEAVVGGFPTPTSPRVSVLGGWVDPGDVVTGGNHKQHGTDRGVAVSVAGGGGATATMVVNASDALLTVWGTPSALPELTAATYSPDFSFLLSARPWGVNYAMWSPFKPGDADQAWHFSLYFV